MSETTTNLLDLFCDTYGVPAEQKKHIESLMNMSYQEGKIAMRQEFIDNIGK